MCLLIKASVIFKETGGLKGSRCLCWSRNKCLAVNHHPHETERDNLSALMDAYNFAEYDVGPDLHHWIIGLHQTMQIGMTQESARVTASHI